MKGIDDHEKEEKVENGTTQNQINEDQEENNKRNLFKEFR